MTVVFAVVIIALIVERVLAELRNEKRWASWEAERTHLVNVIIAKNPTELRVLDGTREPVRYPDVPMPEGFEGIAGLD